MEARTVGGKLMSDGGSVMSDAKTVMRDLVPVIGYCHVKNCESGSSQNEK